MSTLLKRLRKGAAATAVGALVAAPLAIAVGTTAAVAAEPHVDNPFAGASQYVNLKWSENVEKEAKALEASKPALAAQMRAIKYEPTAVWMDRIGAIGGNVDGPGLRYHLDQALLQKEAGVPLVLNLVIYNLPGRDCYALASNGELPATAAALQRYKSEYIDVIADILAEPKYAGIRIAATIEPDSLPNLTTNMHEQACVTSEPFYREGVKYALDELSAISNVYTYVDAAHSGWLGWENNAADSVQTFVEVAQSTKKGFASIDGFVTNTANTTPLNEPFMPDVNKQVGGAPIRSSNFYEWNMTFDEIDWTADLHRRLVAAGFPASTGMLIDTSRNGWGGSSRPTAASTSSDLNTFVNQSKVDRRSHRGAWCNPAGAGIGERPQASPSGYTASHLDAFVWVKPPGESDGSSTLIPNDEGKGFDRMCDPTFNSPKLDGKLTGALPGAPVSGKWFSTQFQELVNNSYPVITSADNQPNPGGTDGGTTDGGTTDGGTTDGGTTDGGTTDGGTTDGGTTDGGTTDGGTTDGGTTDGGTTDGGTTDGGTTDGGTTDGGTAPACAATYNTAGNWGSGFQGNINVTATKPVTSWTLTFTMPNATINNIWGGKATGTNTITVTNEAWNGTLSTGQTATVGFIGNGTAPTNLTITCN